MRGAAGNVACVTRSVGAFRADQGDVSGGHSVAVTRARHASGNRDGHAVVARGLRPACGCPLDRRRRRFARAGG